MQEPPKITMKKSIQEPPAKPEDKERIERKKKREEKKHVNKDVAGMSSTQLYLNLVEEWRKKVPENLYTITLEKKRLTLKDAENQFTKEEVYRVIDTNVPRANPSKRLNMNDQVWSIMPYKNLTPQQKYKKYKKITMKLKTQEDKEKMNKYIKSTKRALREEQKGNTTKSNSLLRDVHLVVDGNREIGEF